MNWLKIKLKFFDDDELMFKLGTGLKFTFLSMGFTFTVVFFTYLLLKIDLLFFVAHGFPGATEFQDAFYSFVTGSLIDELPLLIISMVVIFGCGFYIGSIMIRPFKVIAQTCEDRMNNNVIFYKPDFFSDLKLLTTFTSFFFSKIDIAKERGSLVKQEIPEDFTKIHKPIFEKNFFVNYVFIIIIFALLASVAISLVNNAVRDQVLELSHKFLSGNKDAKQFLEEQFIVADIAINFFIIIHITCYFILGVHLYGKVASPAFAVFATLRSFLRGNYHNRIHLVGFYYLRNDCRKINKYLDQVQKELTK